MVQEMARKTAEKMSGYRIIESKARKLLSIRS